MQTLWEKKRYGYLHASEYLRKNPKMKEYVAKRYGDRHLTGSQLAKAKTHGLLLRVWNAPCRPPLPLHWKQSGLEP